MVLKKRDIPLIVSYGGVHTPPLRRPSVEKQEDGDDEGAIGKIQDDNDQHLIKESLTTIRDDSFKPIS